MKEMRQVWVGFFMALLFSGAVLGSFSLSFLEAGVPLAQAPSPTATSESVFPTFINVMPGKLTATYQAKMAAMATPTETFTPSTRCPPPDGWVALVVLPGDTLPGLAKMYAVKTSLLASANCLVTNTLLPGTIIFVPASLPKASPTRPYPYTRTPSRPTPTRPVVQCGPPFGWVYYTVRPGDTLYQLSLNYRVTVTQLQQANCMGGSTVIHVGDLLSVPYLPTSTPRPSATRWPTLPPSATFPFATPSRTSTSPATVATQTATSTAIQATTTGTATSLPLVTATPTETTVPTPTRTATSVPTSTNTATPLPTATTAPTATTQPTATNMPTSTSTPVPPVVPTAVPPTSTPVGGFVLDSLYLFSQPFLIGLK